jgi:hypothetical protein
MHEPPEMAHRDILLRLHKAAGVGARETSTKTYEDAPSGIPTGKCRLSQHLARGWLVEAV